MHLRVLGVDPGSRITGWGLVTGNAARAEFLDAGVIRMTGSQLDFSQRLARLQQEIVVLIDRLRPDLGAVETPFQGVNPRSALQLAHARGVVLAAMAGAGIPVAEYTPAMVKKSVTGSGRASKDQVRSMVLRLLSTPDQQQPDDLTDALAVGLCHLAVGHYDAVVARSEARSAARVRRPRR